MKVPVQLYIRVKLGDGSYPYLRAAMLPNGHVRPSYAIHAGRTAKIDGGVYHLSYRKEGKRAWGAGWHRRRCGARETARRSAVRSKMPS